MTKTGLKGTKKCLLPCTPLANIKVLEYLKVSKHVYVCVLVCVCVCVCARARARACVCTHARFRASVCVHLHLMHDI